MKKHDFLEVLMGSPVRSRLLRTFVLNAHEVFSQETLAKRAKATSSAVARELASLQAAGVIKGTKHLVPVLAKSKTGKKGAKKMEKKAEFMWQSNPEFRYARALSVFVHEVAPVRYDDIVEGLKRSGKLSTVILSGTFMGDPSRPADLLVAADVLDERRLETAVKRLEPAYGREIRYASFSTHEFQYRMTVQDRLLRDTLEYPHLVLFDRTRLLS
ncbi:hypothetical protein FJY94_02585 [Candidatus Kaiserbacteria bacterium]|nr:hypothetical protein [Candidatus Kaiserbacteria bacterium]